ncbi:MAG TPA: class I SAM-dependent methyltransferase [Candidatus Binataceae bacterium]|nr:class I SAM-dependent methyltransferase [Candidatus Binataceae bacterium]
MTVTHAQSWDPERYARNARFVSDLGAPVLGLLDPRQGERILDLGCGDGVLTRKLVDAGCEVVGIDASSEQIAGARKLGLDARVGDAEALNFDGEFNAVFSNAALHWMKRADPVIAGVWRALRPSGRFVGEMGGFGCVAKIKSALMAAMARRGIDGEAHNPWYFPTVEDYSARLVRGKFAVEYIALIPRPTPLPGDVIGWLETFAESFSAAVAPGERRVFLFEVRDELREKLCGPDGVWVVDYVRLRFAARRIDE